MNEIIKEIENNPVLKEVKNVLIRQTKKGLEKYGTTVQYQNLSVTEWINHAKEETADKLVYLTCLEKSIQELEAKVKAFDNIHGILNDYHQAGTLSDIMAIELMGIEISSAFKAIYGDLKVTDE